MIVLISGSRHMPADKKYLITAELEKIAVVEGSLVDYVTVVHGGARGADTLAGEAADALGLPVIVEAADWGRLGRAAGFHRNQRMLDKWKPELALFFHHEPTLGKGTADMFMRCRRAGVPTQVIIY